MKYLPDPGEYDDDSCGPLATRLIPPFDEVDLFFDIHEGILHYEIVDSFQIYGPNGIFELQSVSPLFETFKIR